MVSLRVLIDGDIIEDSYILNVLFPGQYLGKKVAKSSKF